MMGAANQPHDLEAEKAVIGAVLASQKAYGAVSQVLAGPGDFYSEANRDVFRAVRSLSEDARPVDRVTVLREIDENLDLPGPTRKALRNYVNELCSSLPTAANADRHAEAVRSLAFRRELMRLAASTERAASEGEGRGVEAAEELHRAATRTRPDEDVHTFRSGLESYTKRVAMRSEGRGVMGIPTGLAKLDHATTGWHDGDLIILGARPAQAKTLFLWQSAITAARHGKKAFVMNLEMAYERIQERCACATSGVSYETWRRGSFGSDDAERLLDAYERLSDLPVYVHNPKAGRTVEDLKRAVRALRPDIVFVDYLQLLATEKAARTDLYTAVTQVSNDLKQLALAERVPVVCAAQLSRRVEERFDKRPIMADLRESGYLEQDADAVVMMYRDAYYYPEGVREGRRGEEPVPNFHPQKVEFIARKDREGGNWAVDAYFEGPRMWLSDEPYAVVGRAS